MSILSLYSTVMFIQQVRQFGRNISNIDDHRRTSKNAIKKQPVKKAVLPRAAASFSVYADCSKENQPPPGLTTAGKLPHQLAEHREPLKQIYSSPAEPMEQEMEDCVMEDIEPLMSELDIDSKDSHNPQFVSQYVQEIFDFLKQKEIDVMINPESMKTIQNSVEPRHRDILINWICEVYLQLKLLSETLFLIVDIVDRLLSLRVVTKRKLHLVGIGAIMIATKFEETYPPPLSDLQICSENAYTDDEILRVERVILNALDFNLCIPSPLMFLRRYSKAAESDSETHTLSKYIVELSVTSSSIIGQLPSHIAASAVFLARRMRNEAPLWPVAFLHHAEVTPEEIYPCIVKLNELLIEVSQKGTNAIYRKYSDKRLFSVSKISPIPL